MNSSTIENALRRLGEALDFHREVEIVLVGGAAAMLTGLLPPHRTTIDCDVMVYLPPDAMASVERAAESIARQLSLPPTWLNSDVQLRRDAMPDGWEDRKIPIDTFGRLRVWAVSRPDLIAMKVLAGRAQDIEDLEAMRLRADDVAFVHAYLDTLHPKGTHHDQIDDARHLLDSLEIHDRER